MTDNRGGLVIIEHFYDFVRRQLDTFRTAAMDSLSGVQASGVVVEQFEDAGGGRCRRAWSISTHSLSFSGPQNCGSAVELKGEIFVKGLRAYAFHASEASFERLDKPPGAVRVSGQMNVEDLERGASFSCKELTWMPELRSLSLDQGVTASLPSKLKVTCPKLTISAAESSRTLEETIASVSDQRRRGCLTSASFGHSAILHGPCRGWVRLPFSELSLGSLATLPPAMQTACRESPGGLELAFCAQGVFLDMKHKALMAQGPLSISCFQNECKIGAGAGDILLEEGLVTLHEYVCSRYYGYELKAPILTWYYGRSKEAEGWRATEGLKKTDLRKFGLHNVQMRADIPTSNAADANLSRFKTEVGRMQATRQIARKGLGIWTACRSMAVGDSSVPRSIGRPKKFDIFRTVAKQICNNTVSIDSYGVHVELSQILQRIPILEGCIVNFGVPLTTESQVMERNVYPILAAREEKAMACGLVTGDFVANGPICLCKE